MVKKYDESQISIKQMIVDLNIDNITMPEDMD